MTISFPSTRFSAHSLSISFTYTIMQGEAKPVETWKHVVSLNPSLKTSLTKDYIYMGSTSKKALSNKMGKQLPTSFLVKSVTNLFVF